MCFSATASFTAAGILGAAGLVSMKSVPRPAERAYGAIPLFFAAHQATEGFLWLTLNGTLTGTLAQNFGDVFAFVAYIVWPTLVPILVLPMETHRWRRQVIWGCLAIGVATSIAFIVQFYRAGFSPGITEHGISYFFAYSPVLFWNYMYGTAACVPFWASKYFWVRAFGVAIALSYQVAFRFFYQAHASVWCYFAAVLSVMVILHLRRVPPGSQATRLASPSRRPS